MARLAQVHPDRSLSFNNFRAPTPNMDSDSDDDASTQSTTPTAPPAQPRAQISGLASGGRPSNENQHQVGRTSTNTVQLSSGEPRQKPRDTRKRESISARHRRRTIFGSSFQELEPTEPGKESTPTKQYRPRQSSLFDTTEYFDAEEGESILTPTRPVEKEANDLTDDRQQQMTHRQGQPSNVSKKRRDADSEGESDLSDDSDEDDFEPAEEDDLVVRDIPRSVFMETSRGPIKVRPAFLPCTPVNEPTTKRIKRAARDLCLYDESQEIFGKLHDRLKKMLDMEARKARRDGRPVASIADLAGKLLAWLEEIEEGRIRTGENPKYVEHELDWAEWIQEAAKARVLHVKTGKCQCKSEFNKKF
ncbi:hypothetical protein M011DRAFT_465205 [Sporormia fimetaria CBS 119925]|uniref:Uncharacterized protein n=1 Tax=Sporormia fimetaria CBS 119925 TaxID=1340428 RepID=A0A6A6VL57_9PLEO|nr:hypothetical protein M011DRAFT_465205 [Sporormia fimetaria CBS 119925]